MSLKGNTMSIIPVSVTGKQFGEFIEPSLSKAKRGYVCRLGLSLIFNAILYKLHTGCQWAKLPMVSLIPSTQVALSWWAVYYHFRKWKGVFNRAYHAVILVAPMTRCYLLLKTLRKDGSLESVFKASLVTIQDDLDLSELNLDGSHTIAKKGGESVVYQGRKKAKTCNLLPLTEACGFILGLGHLLPGNHNDTYNLKPALATAFKRVKRLGLDIRGALSFVQRRCWF
jgi:hypothetical protein